MTHDERAANRAAAERAEAQRKAYQSEIADATLRRRQQIDALARQAAELVPAALATCAQRNYEGIAELKRKRRTLFGGYKDERFGGYPLCTLMATSYGEQIPRETYLGADGSIWPWAKDLDEYVRLVRETEAVDGSNRKPESAHGLFSIAAFETVVKSLQRLAAGNLR